MGKTVYQKVTYLIILSGSYGFYIPVHIHAFDHKLGITIFSMFLPVSVHQSQIIMNMIVLGSLQFAFSQVDAGPNPPTKPIFFIISYYLQSFFDVFFSCRLCFPVYHRLQNLYFTAIITENFW